MIRPDLPASSLTLGHPSARTAPVEGGGVGVRTQGRKEVTGPWDPLNFRAPPLWTFATRGQPHPLAAQKTGIIPWVLGSRCPARRGAPAGGAACGPHPHLLAHLSWTIPAGGGRGRPYPQPACGDTGGDTSPAPGNLSTYVSGFIIHVCPSADRFSLLPAESGNTEY